jgi:hypothetical protein
MLAVSRRGTSLLRRYVWAKSDEFTVTNGHTFSLLVRGRVSVVNVTRRSFIGRARDMWQRRECDDNALS